MQYDLRTNRRETAVNVSLGSALILTFAAVLALIAIYVLVLPGPSNRDVERRSFLLSTSLLCLAVLLNTGALGSGALFRGANRFLYACVGAWWFILLRKGWTDNNVGPNAIPTT